MFGDFSFCVNLRLFVCVFILYIPIRWICLCVQQVVVMTNEQ